MSTRSDHPTRAAHRDRRQPTHPMVLHIDDDPNDAELLRAATRKARVNFTLHNVPDADHALAYLKRHEGNGSAGRFPALILLDLKMPRATGFEVLKWIRSDPVFSRLPVLVLSGSELKDDMQQAYALGANSYLVKPLSFDALVRLVQEIDSVWLGGMPAQPELPLSQAPAALHPSSPVTWQADS